MNDVLKNTKILVVTTVPETIKAFLLPQLASLCARGCEVHVATGAGCELPELASLGVVEHRLSLTRHISPVKDWKALWEMVRLCRRFRFDLVHSHTLKASLIGQLAARVTSVPVRLETAHGTRYMSDLPFVVREVIIWSEQIAARKVHHLWVLNQEDYELFRKRHVARPEVLEIIGEGGIGVDIHQFRPCLLTIEHRKEYQQNLGLPRESLVVGFVGRLVRDKGVLELTEAWPEVVEAIPTAYLLIITAKLVSERSSELVSESRLRQLPNTVLLSNRSDMPYLYNCMDLLVLPSYREGFSRVIVEASACGVPVVASDVRGCRDAVVDGQTGILIQPRLPEELASAVRNLLLDKSKRINMGQLAREHALRYFNQDEVINHINQSYIELLRKHTKNRIDW